MAYSLVLPFHQDLTSIARTARRARAEGGGHGVGEVVLAHNGLALSPEKQATVDALVMPAGSGAPEVRFVHTDRKGLGAGYKLGILEAREEHVILSADDLPFGWTDLLAFEKAGKPDFAIGSKAHPDSNVQGVTMLRQVSTSVFRALRVLVLGRSTPQDSQGSLIIRTDVAKRLVPDMRYDDYLASLELATIHLFGGGEVVEVPVRLEHEPHPSSVSVFRDGSRMARGLLELRSRRR